MQKSTPKWLFTRRFSPDAAYWPYLTMRGPYAHILPEFDDDFYQNRRLLAVIRWILEKVHANSFKYREELSTGTPTHSPTIAEMRRIAGNMCEKVWKLEENGEVFNLYSEKMHESLPGFLHCARIRVPDVQFPNIELTLTKLFDFKKVTVSTGKLKMLVRHLVRYALLMTCDLCSYLLETSYDSTVGTMNILSFKKRSIWDQKQRYWSDDKLQIQLGAFFENVRVGELDRNGPVSLWTVIPCEEAAHLLKHVLEHGLVGLLPRGVDEFLTKWIIEVRGRMRRMLRGAELRDEAWKAFGSIDGPFDSKHPYVAEFAVFVVKELLNTREFRVFGYDWQEELIGVVRSLERCPMTNTKEQLMKSFDAVKCEDIFETFSKDGRLVLYPLFSNSKAEQALLQHTVVQLFRFVAILAFNTLRQVLSLTDNGHFWFDGSFEVKITNFNVFEQDNKPRAAARSEGNVAMEQKWSSRPMRLSEPVIKQEPALSNEPSESPEGLKLEPELQIYPDVFDPLENLEIKQEPPEPAWNYESLFQTPVEVILSSEGEDNDLEGSNVCSTSSAGEPNHRKRNLVSESQSSSKVRKMSLPPNHNDEEHSREVPQRWVEAYNLTLEWNCELKEERASVLDRLSRLESIQVLP